MEPTIKGVQVAIFYKPIYIGSNVNAESLMKENFGDEVQINSYPIPQDAPAEIPRLNIQLNNFSFNFSNIRADMIVNDVEPTQAELDNFFNVILAFNTDIIRVGYVTRKNYENVSDVFLRANFNLDVNRFVDLNEVAESSWRVNRIQTIGDGECNNISTLSLDFSNNQSNILLERDVNTVQSRSNLNINDLASLNSLVETLKIESNRPFGITDHG